jgi:hypothetical protein
VSYQVFRHRLAQIELVIDNKNLGLAGHVTAV